MTKKKTVQKDDTTERTFLITDACMWEMNKQAGSYHPHAIEVVDTETGQVRYISSGAHIKFIGGNISKGRSQDDYNKGLEDK